MFPSASSTFRLEAGVVAEFTRLAASDPAARSFHQNGMRTLSVDCDRAYSSPAARELRELAQAHGIRHCLASGTPANGERKPGWVVLTRGRDIPFREADCAYLKAVWPHLVRCLGTVRRRVLAELAQAHGPGVALLHPDGSVAAADGQFASLCQAEWRTGVSALLPAHAYATLKDRGDFAGRTLRLYLWYQDGFTACTAEPRTSCELLTRAERVVAFRYASGESYKEIAIGLSVSDNTVRTHLAHVFDKLGIHRKAELIRQIGNLH
ncbi:MAG TPA: helix-turn-helix domain-containing protein [Telluria sp.]|nr:helix-turn-helix domain-containing protein [Telluria sp.]